MDPNILDAITHPEVWARLDDQTKATIVQMLSAGQPQMQPQQVPGDGYGPSGPGQFPAPPMASPGDGYGPSGRPGPSPIDQFLGR